MQLQSLAKAQGGLDAYCKIIQKEKLLNKHHKLTIIIPIK